MRRIIFFVICWLMLGTDMAQSAVSTLLADTKTGLVISSQNEKTQQYPASLTKVMTLYLTFNALENGLLKMDDVLPVSLHAAKQPASKLYLKAGNTIRVRDAINALIIKSANDAAVVLAESLAPSESDFAKMMTETAKQLGLKNTVFRNASGLHHPAQVTTAQDMAILTIALINHFPQYYKMFNKNEFTYRGKVYKTHNRVTQNYKGAEGLKTGYVAAVGYNIISTAKRGNQRLVTVVIGQKSSSVRDKQAINLLDKGFLITQSQKSVLRKLKRNGNVLNIKTATTQPDLKRQLTIMEKRLAQVKKVSDNAQSTQLAKVEKNGKFNKLSLPDAVIELDEIEQGDQDETGTNNDLSQTHVPDILNDTFIAQKNLIQKEDLSHNQIKSAEEPPAQTVRTFSADNPVLTANKLIVSSKDKTVAYQPLPLDLQSVKTENNSNIQNKIQTESSELNQENEIIPNKTSKSDNKKISDEIITLNETTPSEIILSEQESSKSDTQTNMQNKTDNISVADTSTDTMQLRKASWGIQVGAFVNKSAAQKQADNALKLVRGSDKFIKIIQTDQFYRSRIYGFKTKKAANLACRRLKNNHINCLTLSPKKQSPL